jgi:fatty acid desaturase
MNIRQDIKELKTGDRDLRKFGLLVGGVFTFFGTLYLLRHKPIYSWFLIPGFVLMAVGALFPRGLKHVYMVWMSLAIVMGFVVSNVLLILLFFLVITPIGLLARLFKKDFLSLKLDRAAKSYWIPRGPKARSQAEYERQF